MQKQVKNKKLLTILILLLVGLLSVGTAFAVDLFSIEEKRYYASGTTSFNLGANYYSTVASVGGNASISVSRDGSDTTKSFDLIVYSSNPVSIGALAKEQVQTSTDLVTIFSNVTYVDNGGSMNLTIATTDPSLKVVVVTYSTKNTYIASYFDLQKSNTQASHNIADVLTKPTGKMDYFKYLYFIADFSIPENFDLNYPCDINLLHSTVSLDGILRILHYGVGNFSFSACGEFGKFDNSVNMLYVLAPNAYYRADNIASIVTVADNFVQRTDIDFSAAGNEAAKTGILANAGQYAFATISDRVYTGLFFPEQYQTMGITYQYSSSNTSVVTNTGQVIRGVEDQTVTITANMHFLGEVHPVTKEITVVGTSETALATAMAGTLDKLITSFEATVGEDSFLVEDITIDNLITLVIRNSGMTQDFKLSLTNSAFLNFVLDGAKTEELFFKQVSGAYQVSSDNTTFVPLTNATNIVIDIETWVLSNSQEQLDVTVGTTGTSFINIPLKAVTVEERHNYLNRFMNDIFFSDSSSTSSLLWLSSDKLYSGNSSVPIVDSGLGMSSITHNIYLISANNLTELQNKTRTLAQVVADPSTQDYMSYFAITNGVLSALDNTILRLPDDTALIIVTSLNYADSTKYERVNQVIIPEQGLGGSEFLEYIKGDTFGYYFEGLENGQLIDSVANDTAFVFQLDGGVVGVKFEILTENVDSFVQIVNSQNTSQINITVDNIPSVNTVINLQASIYLVDDPTEVISVQPYNFIVPGIYKKGVDFADDVVYDAVIAAESGGVSLYRSFQGYLLVDGANTEVETVDLSLSKLVGKTASDVIDMTGVHLLKGTKGFVFDNVNFASLEIFKQFNNLAVSNLSLVNCQISDSELSTGALYSLNNLKTIDLSFNNLTTLAYGANAVVYRTVAELDISNQVNLTNLIGVTRITELEILKVNNNKIPDFNLLTDIPQLKQVYLYDNTTTEFVHGGDTNVYLGTLGEINRSVYVWLIGRGVEVYHLYDSGTSTAQKYVAAEDERIAGMAINAISIPLLQNGTIQMPNQVFLYGNDAIIYTITVNYAIVDGVAVSFTHTSDQVDVPSVTAQKTVQLIYSININGETIFRKTDFVLNP